MSKTGDDLSRKLIRTFLPSGRDGYRLLPQGYSESDGKLEVHFGSTSLEASFGAFGLRSTEVPDELSDWCIESAYIPVKEVLANAPGFLSLYSAREIHFEEVYEDILLKVYLPPLREPIDSRHWRMLNELQNLLGGKIIVSGEEFFLSNDQGDLEFTLLAEGWRKLGLLWLLIQNGTLQSGSVLFWDEPEANLNPKMFKTVMSVLLELQRAGVQVFFATHDYVILKELDLQMTEEDAVAFHSLYRDEKGEIDCRSTGKYLDIHPSAINEAFDDLYDREIERSLGGLNR